MNDLLPPPYRRLITRRRGLALLGSSGLGLLTAGTSGGFGSALLKRRTAMTSLRTRRALALVPVPV
jgi:hypothetical protein